MSALPKIKSISEKRSVSRDEMNLAEFPLAVLSTRSNPKIKTLEFQDTIKGKNGEIVKRGWVITGADKFGLPTASDDEVLLGLMKLTVNDGFKDQKIYFTRYELLKILKWSTEGRSYSRLQNALDRLSGVRVKATNAFYDNETKSHSTKNFGVLDAYEINDGRDSNPKPSFFIWSEELFKSFQAGFIKKLDLSFLLQLRSAVSKRLYRYLDKHFWYKTKVQTNLFTLAHEKIGISRNYKYASAIRQQLDPAVEELIEAGFISECNYIGRGKNTEIVLFAARGKPRSASKNEPFQISVVSSADEHSEPDDLEALRHTISVKLQERGLKESQAGKLLQDCSARILRRISKIIDHFDYLIRTESRLISKSSVGFLYRAIERPETFVLPGESRKNTAQMSLLSGGKEREEKPAARIRRNEELALKAEYQLARKKELTRLRAEVEPEVEKRFKAEAEESLKRVKGVISDSRFKEAVDHSVEEKLVSLFAFPDFEEWFSLRKKR